MTKEDKMLSTFDITKIHIPRWAELPDLALYSEQVTSLLENTLGPVYELTRTPMISKSMINNYVKNGIIIPPEKKVYPKSSVASLIVIGILKNVYSMDEISQLLQYGFKLGPNGKIYDRFAQAIEDAMVAVFSGNIQMLDTKERESKYLMGNFALSYACKVYVQATFIYGEVNNESL